MIRVQKAFAVEIFGLKFAVWILPAKVPVSVFGLSTACEGSV